MSNDLTALTLKMTADVRGLEKQMERARIKVDRELDNIVKDARKADKNLDRQMSAMGRRAGDGLVGGLRNSLGGIAPLLAGAFSAGAVIKYADAYTGLQNRLKATGLEGEALRKVEDSLYASANRNGVAVEATAELYQRAAMARNNLGASEEQLLALVSGTSAALKLQGTSAGEASGALLQLGQILGGEKVQAQEYNSLIDQLPVLLQAAADGSGKFGGEIATLTQQVKAGRPTTGNQSHGQGQSERVRADWRRGAASEAAPKPAPLPGGRRPKRRVGSASLDLVKVRDRPCLPSGNGDGSPMTLAQGFTTSLDVR